VKNASTHANTLSALLKDLESRYGSQVELPAATEPVTQVVIGFLEWEATKKQADAAFDRLMNIAVDMNDLRVCLVEELAEAMGPRYPRVEERAARLKDVLNAIYVREYATSLESLSNKPKREIKEYLDTLPGMVPYVASQTLLLSFAGHAIPVDERLMALLRERGAIAPEATLDDVIGFMDRTIKASDALATHAWLRTWVDDSPAPKPPRRKSSSGKKSTTRKSKTKKSTSKKSSAAASAAGGASSAGKKSDAKKTTRKTKTTTSRSKSSSTKSSGASKKKVTKKK